MLKPHVLTTGARTIATKIAPIEEGIDDAILAQAGLIADLIQTRKAAGLPGTIGQDLLAAQQIAMAAAIVARGAFIDAHREFAALRDDLRIKVTAEGSGSGCPHDNFVRGGADIPVRSIA